MVWLLDPSRWRQAAQGQRSGTHDAYSMAPGSPLASTGSASGRPSVVVCARWAVPGHSGVRGGVRVGSAGSSPGVLEILEVVRFRYLAGLACSLG